MPLSASGADTSSFAICPRGSRTLSISPDGGAACSSPRRFARRIACLTVPLRKPQRNPTAKGMAPPSLPLGYHPAVRRCRRRTAQVGLYLDTHPSQEWRTGCLVKGKPVERAPISPLDSHAIRTPTGGARQPAGYAGMMFGWRKRMGIEPTLADHKPPNNGFEDRGRHQPPSASARYCSRLGFGQQGGTLPTYWTAESHHEVSLDSRSSQKMMSSTSGKIVSVTCTLPVVPANRSTMTHQLPGLTPEVISGADTAS